MGLTETLKRNKEIREGLNGDDNPLFLLKRYRDKIKQLQKKEDELKARLTEKAKQSQIKKGDSQIIGIGDWRFELQPIKRTVDVDEEALTELCYKRGWDYPQKMIPEFDEAKFEKLKSKMSEKDLARILVVGEQKYRTIVYHKDGNDK